MAIHELSNSVTSGPLSQNTYLFGVKSGLTDPEPDTIKIDLVYDYLKTRFDVVYPTLVQLANVSAIASSALSQNLGLWDGRGLASTGFLPATSASGLVTLAQVEAIAGDSGAHYPGADPIINIDTASDLMLIYDVTGAGTYNSITIDALIDAGLDVASINGLGDVAAETAVAGDLLQWSGVNWINRSFDDLDIITATQIADGYQPLDSNLTEISALTTTLYGRSALTLADATAARTWADVYSTGQADAAYQPKDADLTAIAGLTTTAFGRSALELIDAAAARAWADVYSTGQVDAGFQPKDADLTEIAGLTTEVYGRSFLELSDASMARTYMSVDAAGTDNSINVSLAGGYDYLTLVGQTLTLNTIDLASDVSGNLPASSVVIADVGNLFTATQVESALAESQQAIDAIESDYLKAADISNVVRSPDIGVSVQAYSDRLLDIAALAAADGDILIGNGATWVTESGATARSSLGLGTADSPTFAGVTIGASSPFSDAAGVLTLQNVDALDATTKATIQAEITDLANLVNVQSQTITLSNAGTNAFLGWDNAASAYQNLTSGEATAIINAFVGDAGAGGTKGSVPAPSIGDAGKFLRGDGGWVTIPGGGDALTSNGLAQFAATTSAQLAGVMSDETGTGELVFATSPTLVTPALGTPASGVLTNCTGLPLASVVEYATVLVTSSIGVTVQGYDANTAKYNDATSNFTGTLQKSGSNVLTASNIGSTVQGYNADLPIAEIAFVIDGGGAAIATGLKGFVEVPFNCQIDRVALLADRAGSIVVDIWKDAYANYPPSDADSITASAPPTISSSVKSEDATLTGWTKVISAGDILAFNVDSVSAIQLVTVSLKVTKT